MKNDKIRNRNRSLAAVALGIIFMLICAGIAGAQTELDTSKKASLKVSMKVPDTTTGIKDLRMTLYKAASMEVTSGGNVEFTLVDEFKPYDEYVDGGLDPNNFESGSWAKAATSIAPYVMNDAAKGKGFESASALTDQDGNVSFSNLSQGLWLLTGNYEGSEYASVTVNPVFLTLPQWDNKNSIWIYDAEASGKPSVNIVEKDMSVTVKKVWASSGTATAGTTSTSTPASVTVELLNGNGETVSTQTLDASNAWSYTWTGLKVGQWSVKETVPAGYSASITEEATENGKIITIKNSTSSGGVLGASREKESTTKKTKGSSRETDSAVAGDTRLPQTGQLWWPIWLLSGLAAVLVVIGLILRLSGKKDLKDK